MGQLIIYNIRRGYRPASQCRRSCTYRGTLRYGTPRLNCTQKQTKKGQARIREKRVRAFFCIIPGMDYRSIDSSCAEKYRFLIRRKRVFFHCVLPRNQRFSACFHRISQRFLQCFVRYDSVRIPINSCLRLSGSMPEDVRRRDIPSELPCRHGCDRSLCTAR